MRELANIPHVEIVRFHTRVPSVAPEKINDELVAALKQHPATYIVVHINHADEINTIVSEKLAKLVDAGIPLLSQTVLLKGINDDPAILTNLFKKLLKNRVKPYYLHHADLAKGTSHFRTSIEDGQRIVKQLRGPISGLCQPHYVLDLPRGHGKIPIGPTYINERAPNSYDIEDVYGGTHRYDEIIENH
jgi:lysine 2,3-aminomutase